MNDVKKIDDRGQALAKYRSPPAPRPLPSTPQTAPATHAVLCPNVYSTFHAAWVEWRLAMSAMAQATLPTAGPDSRSLIFSSLFCSPY